MEGPVIQRVLVANRGEVASRLFRFFREREIETVSAFLEAEVDQPWVSEADYDAYLNGKTVATSYLDVMRVVGAAADAGCDAIHPGYCFLAERVDLITVAANANLAVIGADPRALARVVDRFEVRRRARELGLPVVPGTEPLGDEDDGVEAGAGFGFPLFVKAVGGGVVRRVERVEALPAAVAAVRAAARLVAGDARVYLERALPRLRSIGVNVIGDRHGTMVHVGCTDGSLQFPGVPTGVAVGSGDLGVPRAPGHDFKSWVEELGAVVEPALAERLGNESVALMRDLGWVGVGKVRWAVTPDGGHYLLGVSGRLTAGYSLVETAYNVDLIDVQYRTWLGEPLGWGQRDVPANRHGVELRVVPFDRDDPYASIKGTIERLELPDQEDVMAVTGTAEGQAVTPETDPLLVKITISGPTRHAALVRARHALEALVIEGVPTNREVLLELLADERVWRGEHDVATLGAHLGV
jgi:acetyl/propionyl-CoA carboxylase alpha subunit